MVLRSSSLKNLAKGDCHPSGLILAQARPLAPQPWARATRSSSSFREKEAPPGTRMALMQPPFWATSAKTLTSEFLDQGGQVGYFQPEPQVRTVGSITVHGLFIGQTTEGPGNFQFQESA